MSIPSIPVLCISLHRLLTNLPAIFICILQIIAYNVLSVPTTFSFQYPFTYDLHGRYSSLSFNPGSSSYLLFSIPSSSLYSIDTRSCLSLDDLSLQQKYILSHPLSSSITSHATLSHPSFSHCTFFGLENGWILQYDDRERSFHVFFPSSSKELETLSPQATRS